MIQNKDENWTRQFFHMAPTSHTGATCPGGHSHRAKDGKTPRIEIEYVDRVENVNGIPFLAEYTGPGNQISIIIIGSPAGSWAELQLAAVNTMLVNF